MDTLAEQLKYDDYVELSTPSCGQSTAGEGGGVFRDPPEIKAMAERYNTMKARAEKACLIQ